MKLKLDDAGHVVVSDGKPVYVTDDGKEVAFDAVATKATIDRITQESKGYKARAQDAETKLQAFDGIEDPAAAKDAMSMVASFKDKDLIEAGKVEEIKAAAIKAVEDRYKPVVAEVDALKAELYAEKIGGSFARSKFIQDKIAVPSDIVEARFGKHFKLDGGKVVAVDHAGNTIYSEANPGNPADFDEALAFLVNSYPQKDYILKGSGGNGAGARGGAGNGAGKKTYTRAEFDKLPPMEQRSVSMEVAGGKAALVD